ncbi:DUF7853 family protein [Halorubrum vacuolatum]|uniref:Uncharacterized protein n=1 Tax=Halorubrum vacuolatum TaxID=63740 RepID=A0A238UUQ3_HALVU|nr:hypothetical protein [Halorubrum vacuolatum]SNR25756.1 hypothetical protein SAMN06264855_101399 [Halorubrum vacuolatum]
MTPPPTDDHPLPSASHEEAWVAHAALLAAGQTAVDGGDDDPPHVRPLGRIERKRSLAPEELALLRDALIDYLGDAPVRDRAPGRALLRRVIDRLDAADVEDGVGIDAGSGTDDRSAWERT